MKYLNRNCRTPNKGTPHSSPGTGSTHEHKNPLLLQDAWGLFGRALGRHVPRAGGRGVDRETRKLGAFKEARGWEYKEFWQKARGWFINRKITCQQKKGALEPCSGGLGTYLTTSWCIWLYSALRGNRQKGDSGQMVWTLDKMALPVPWLRGDSGQMVLA